MSTSDVPFTAFALFLGVSMSVTAFPVLARILTDRRMRTSALGVMALTCAAVDDVTAWCLLAFVVSVAQAQAERAIETVALTAGFIAFMLVVLRREKHCPPLRRAELSDFIRQLGSLGPRHSIPFAHATYGT